MTVARDLFETVVLPVASAEDARTTCAAAAAHLRRTGGRAVVVHVIEKTGGAPDKASVEQREEGAEETFAAAREACDATEITVETRLEYGTDVAETVFKVANDVDASAVAFTPREASRWIKLLSGDVANALINGGERPVVVLPDHVADDADTTDDAADGGGGG
ncbi:MULTISPECIES: universal stress protein [Halococcus]|uniref:UspA domain protein n=1 Tax=Halococcus salifodinae DSM 8989 TaxID=1227456 RepID=M0NCH8_9EURY|nr:MULTISPECIES: universal stress protein [Halococcus]EMA55283.1 UspA domain protein [Halococcus salifodinae DSM 8989]